MNPDVPLELQPNLPPPAPLKRQVTQFLGDNETQIVGEKKFEIRPNGLVGYTEEDYQNVIKNEGEWIDPKYWDDHGGDTEEEDVPDSEGEGEEEEEDSDNKENIPPRDV